MNNYSKIWKGFFNAILGALFLLFLTNIQISFTKIPITFYFLGISIIVILFNFKQACLTLLLFNSFLFFELPKNLGYSKSAIGFWEINSGFIWGMWLVIIGINLCRIILERDSIQYVVTIGVIISTIIYFLFVTLWVYRWGITNNISELQNLNTVFKLIIFDFTSVIFTQIILLLVSVPFLIKIKQKSSNPIITNVNK